MITAKTRLLGVIGHPIEHSLSPKMHNASFAANGLDYAYVALDVVPEKLPEAVVGLAALRFRGFNVTMPHKENIIPLLDELDKTASISGAVNTVVIQDDGVLRGMNTDGTGFIEACAEADVDFKGKRVLLLGAGGAGAAVATAVLGEGVGEMVIANRTVSRAQDLKTKLEPETGVEISVRSLEDSKDLVGWADVTVNTTYLGMKEEDQLPVPAEELGPGKAICDIVYRSGSDTELARRARDAGARVVTGGRMLLYQGVQAQRIWTGKEPNVEAMSDAISG